MILEICFLKTKKDYEKTTKNTKNHHLPENHLNKKTTFT